MAIKNYQDDSKLAAIIMNTSFPLLTSTADKYWQQLCEISSIEEQPEPIQTQIKRLLGLSDFIRDTVLSDPLKLPPLIETLTNPRQNIDYQKELTTQLEKVSTEAELLDCLRIFRKQHMVAIAALDLLNLQSIEHSLTVTSELADVLIKGTYFWLYEHFCARYGTPMGEFGPQPLLILGMGKLGGKELNFSSDIDLIFCYPSKGEIENGKKTLEHQQFFNRLAQRIIHALHHTNQQGQVFRVDMRLRPLGESGPLVMHMAAFEDYYQEQGREWERYAMVKARILNDQSEYAEELHNILKPFIYRRYLDYSAIDSLREMKSLINQEVRRRGLTNNIKLGSGGIREVEFIAQSFQLIKGGREPRLQFPSILYTLAQLTELDLLPEEEYLQLKKSYLFLRKVEHCLQQFADKQTQVLPDTPLDQARLSAVMNCDDYCQLQQQLNEHSSWINQQFQMLIGDNSNENEAQDMTQTSAFVDAWKLDLTPQEISDLFTQVASKETSESLAHHILELKSSVEKKHPSPKAIVALNTLVPQLLASIICLDESNLDGSELSVLLDRIAHILLTVLRRTTYLQLLVENQGAQQQLVRLCHASPWIAEQIAKYPILLDELLNPVLLYHPTELKEYPDELRQSLLRVEPDDLELQMETLRQFKQIQQLKIAAADVTGVLPIMKVSDHLTFLAEAIINEVVNMAWEQMKQKYGIPDGSSDQNKKFAVIGYGKLGGIELGYGSDLDLVFVHQCDSQITTNGKKSIEANQFYTKLAQRIMHLFMTKTPSGQLYEIDMRLRPSGNAGLLVCHVNGFEQYQLQEAWTWEHQALVRARVVIGSPELTQHIEAIRRDVLCKPRDIETLQQDVTSMRHKMREHLNKGNENWLDVKQDAGAMADIEFLVQFWVLKNAQHCPKMVDWSDNVRLLQQLCSANYISADDKTRLTEAYLDYRNRSHRLTLLEKDNLVDKSQYSEHQKNVKAIWETTFEQPS
ncbi:bifunctional [glutamate--ammonia ligase]-adenylyl-L-tyrosine phosphorylase/[glutamate--ammonia-ligase] adenylyltransferase [Aliiglaciecola sp. 3_MG-2023]|uniref:bifunctional [glutamate--ammonia ligase]-adenylyl-L-tyrosine phosphorylase/[glutamate--ammonia-ligase] adenylyltransferase n=1 Tax=Aliiglaciecola sp. 3_MG-2023 TaxID=3062644 RepID=UPI0026E1DA5F|nr:bifunctional [glutamate--ammonia ligase]-adenylyl-L-tyrosine phosphorylase/[glutamate--ammonia-ligase] adenylyltransferase [Aliiglaciecola sp. 3_MG-2023]MDO6691896.1 bifunctional [glutamate--ammonia ligase]-adenylyl-L-tyrosine phosphorylase/[glutamate--ammonia-ligase] adenylyltransferase [Aliiglaciecola sp. 3_MG-2023]